MNNSSLKASVIISIYQDVEALNAILYALEQQTEKAFEVIIAEDGQSESVHDYLNNHSFSFLIHHISQEDRGFRKTKAVNKAVAAACNDYLMFLDGDCLPHSRYVEEHLRQRELGRVCVGRRVHLGPSLSKWMRSKPLLLKLLENRLAYLLLSLPLFIDHTKNYEIGFRSRFLHKRQTKKYLNIVGCNWSVAKVDMLKINGYNESLPGVGGEDDDLGWRFNGKNIHEKSVKFIVPVYHLHHIERRADVSTNLRIIEENKTKQLYYCENGVDQYLK
ncbi:glycosyltransferase [Agarivorans sp. 1_MG-2023]|uniref:glycosyltransferase n=1 Tax=Agarivorans sp. 1_MG-2023 TaxID=3062634 RepID=UPI0026E1D876|nr:glycosyltransferase [Agarivorans sp. 1_MG-2023]MDO6764344.1 glycosyltransferase [Agarivorans sp. 1_MG-2023]